MSLRMRNWTMPASYLLTLPNIYALIQVSRGSTIPKKQTTSALRHHFKRKHSEIERAEAQPTSSDAEANVEAEKPKKKNPISNIWKLRTQAERRALFQSSIPNWVESKTMLDPKSDRAKVCTSSYSMIHNSLGPHWPTYYFVVICSCWYDP